MPSIKITHASVFPRLGYGVDIFAGLAAISRGIWPTLYQLQTKLQKSRLCMADT